MILNKRLVLAAVLALLGSTTANAHIETFNGSGGTVAQACSDAKKKAQRDGPSLMGDEEVKSLGECLCSRDQNDVYQCTVDANIGKKDER
jgi:hypothetical protein